MEVGWHVYNCSYPFINLNEGVITEKSRAIRLARLCILIDLVLGAHFTVFSGKRAKGLILANLVMGLLRMAKFN